MSFRSWLCRENSWTTRLSWFPALLSVLMPGVLAGLMICTPMRASGQDIVQTRQIDWSLNDPLSSIQFDPFPTSTVNQLVEVTLEFVGDVSMDVVVENFSTLELEDDEWYMDAGANLLLAFGSKPGYDDGGPLWGLGGIIQPDITGPLSAGSGGNPFTNPTAGDVVVNETVSDSIDSRVTADQNLEYYISDEPLQANFQPFLDFVLTPPLDDPNAYINARATELTQRGELTLTYTYVPGLGLPADCNADGVVDFEDLRCVCQEPHAQLDDVLNASGLPLGDLDGDGGVAFADFLILSANYGKEVEGYLNGDLDCNGMVEFADFLSLSAQYGQNQTGMAAASVPEPECGCLVGGVLVCLAGRRRRR